MYTHPLFFLKRKQTQIDYQEIKGLKVDVLKTKQAQMGHHKNKDGAIGGMDLGCCIIPWLEQTEMDEGSWRIGAQGVFIIHRSHFNLKDESRHCKFHNSQDSHAKRQLQEAGKANHNQTKIYKHLYLFVQIMIVCI